MCVGPLSPPGAAGEDEDIMQTPGRGGVWGRARGGDGPVTTS